MKKLWLPLSLYLLLCFNLTALAAEAELRQQLPENVVAYLRLPNIYQLLDPTVNASQAQLAQLHKLEQALNTEVIEPATTLLNPNFVGLVRDIRAPIEVAVLLQPNVPPTFASVLLETELELADLPAFQTWVDNLLLAIPQLKLFKPLNAEGYIGLMAELPLWLHYDVAHKKLSALGGVSATQPLFAEVLQKTTATPHAMHALEEQIDTSNKGLFLWVDAQRLIPLLRSNIPPQDTALLQKWGLFDVRALALGWGLQNYKGRFKALLDMPKTGYRQYLPAIDNDFNLHVDGEPRFLVSLGLSMQTLLQNIEKLLTEPEFAQYAAKYHESKAQFHENTGLTLEEVSRALGNNFTLFGDEGGEYLAIRIQDKAAFYKTMQQLAAQFDGKLEQRTLEQRTYHHLSLNFYAKMTQAEQAKLFKLQQDNPTQGFVLTLLSRIASHLYWTEEGDYVVMGKTPQMLLDHYRAPSNDVTLQSWLTDTQRVDARNALFLATSPTYHTSRYFYYGYLNLLSALADVSKTDFDIFQFPTVNDLKLPKHGSYGMQLRATEELIGLEMQFEYSPIEGLFAGGGFQTVMVIGILAAVAIPAYTDYLNRTKVAAGLNILGSLKTPAEEYYSTKGQFPTPAEIGADHEGKYTKAPVLLPNSSTYAIEFKPHSKLNGALFLQFDIEKNLWECSFEGLPEKLVPTSCR